MKISKKGTTLVELIVAMAIFTVVSSLAISSFITVMRMKELGTNMKNSQQKARVALEQITRLARQADKVEITTSGGNYALKLYFLASTTKSAVKFSFYSTNWAEANNPTGTIYYDSCQTMSGNTCSDADWAASYNAGQDLFGGQGILKLYNATVVNKFEIDDVLPPTLNISINGKIPGGSNNAFFSDSMVINTKAIMENIK